MSDSVYWHLSATTARLVTPRLTGTIQLETPAAGLVDIQLDNRPLADLCLLQVPLAGTNLATLADCYVRGRDLVASYEIAAGDRLHPQIYWRVLEPDQLPAGSIGLELIVSMQTELLDSQPRLQTTSILPAGECLESSDTLDGAGVSSAANLPAGMCLFRPHGSQYSYVEMLHPSDFAAVADSSGCSLQKTSAGLWQLQSQLFPERLEKGVIRRSRLQAIFTPRATDVADALEAHQRFAAAAPPLTA